MDNIVFPHTRFIFSSDLMHYILHAKDLPYRRQIRETARYKFTKVIGMAVDEIGSKRYGEIIVEFDDISRASIKTVKEFSNYIKRKSGSFFLEGFTSKRFLEYCANVTFLAVLAEKNDKKGWDAIIAVNIARVLETQVSTKHSDEHFWKELYDTAVQYLDLVAK